MINLGHIIAGYIGYNIFDNQYQKNREMVYKQQFVIPENKKRNFTRHEKYKYENKIIEYISDKYIFYSQKEVYIKNQKHLFDFYLDDYKLFIEVDEAGHFCYIKPQKKNSDIEKNLYCSSNNLTFLRISHHEIDAGKYQNIIDHVIKNFDKYEGKIIVTNKNAYKGNNTLDNIPESKIIYLEDKDLEKSGLLDVKKWESFNKNPEFNNMSYKKAFLG